MGFPRRPRPPALRPASGRGTGRATAAAALLLFDLLAFAPPLFRGEVFTSQGWIRAHDPWRGTAIGLPQASNPLLADAADANAPALRRLRADPRSLLWNPWVSGGVPGPFELAQGILSPFAWLPALALPEAGIETGILFLKTQFAFLAMHAFLRRRRFGPGPAALGAAAWGFSSGQTVWALFMHSSVSIVFPLLLLSVDRVLTRPPRRALGFAAVSGLLLLSGGFPHWILYGGFAAALLFLFEAAARRDRAIGAAAVLAAAALLAAASLLPPLLAAARVLEAGDYAAERRHLGAAAPPLPLAHLSLYAFPALRGTPLGGDWRPLGWIPGENYAETACGIGPVAAALALCGLFARRRGRLAAYAGLLLLAVALPLYGGGPLAKAVGSIAPLDTALLARAKILIVLALSILSACGLEALLRAAPRLRSLAALPALATAAALAPLLPAFYPAADPRDAVFRETPGIAALRARLDRTGGRFAGLGWALPPNVSQAFGLEDVRGHFFHETGWRRLLASADRGAFGLAGTYLVLDADRLDARAPALDLASVSAVVAPPGAPARPGLQPLYAGRDLTLFARASAFPRFRLVSECRPGGLEEALAADRDTLARTVFLPAADAAGIRGRATGSEGAHSLRVLESGERGFRLEVETASPKVLATSQKRWDPYWRLRLDGRPARALAVDGIFLGLEVPPGRHRIEGRFMIPAVELACGLLGLAGIAAALWAGRRP